MLRCETPTPALLTYARVALGGPTGRIHAATLVSAAKTKTGTWYVLAFDVEGTYDNGQPTGYSRRELGLTNSVHPNGFADRMIPIGDGPTSQGPTVSWANVSWRGSTLAAGRRAVVKAIGCLNEQRS